jgi:hypothetical protein
VTVSWTGPVNVRDHDLTDLDRRIDSANHFFAAWLATLAAVVRA